MLLPTVVDYIQVVGLIMLDCVCRAFLTDFEIAAEFEAFEADLRLILRRGLCWR